MELAQIDGVIATNTTISRDAVRGARHADETGGLSGPPVQQMALQTVTALRRLLPSGVPIIGVGGIDRDLILGLCRRDGALIVVIDLVQAFSD